VPTATDAICADQPGDSFSIADSISAIVLMKPTITRLGDFVQAASQFSLRFVATIPKIDVPSIEFAS